MRSESWTTPDGIIPADAGSTCPETVPRTWRWDHPRGCGEHPAVLVPDARMVGSSPRMRGALHPLEDVVRDTGIIPADAGSTRGASRSTSPCRDHPRGCGEHPTFTVATRERRGSSPRMRGALTDPEPFPAAVGIIPADAGSTGLEPSACVPARDHPRGCGEHLGVIDDLRVDRGIIPADAGSTERAVIEAAGLVGSSPRMRGALEEERRRPPRGGIIPADAGSTQRGGIEHCGIRDHPRGCGEHTFVDDIRGAYEGSSPRMRGAPGIRLRVAVRRGIIPADAGSTSSGPRVAGWRRDHPRGCGEHSRIAGNAVRAPGSSPRMRGAHGGSAVGDVRSGIIPADAGSTRMMRPPFSGDRDHPRGCGEHLSTRRAGGRVEGIIPADAGSTLSAPCARCCAGDHPRGCGEHSDTARSARLASGSSPRMRGALVHAGRDCGVTGIIPADAGSTLADQVFFWHAPHYGMTSGADKIAPASEG